MAIHTDGITDRIDLGTNFSQGSLLVGGFAWAFWANPFWNNPDNQQVVGRFDGTKLFQIGINNLTGWRCTFGTSPFDVVSQATPITPGNWYHIGFSFDGTLGVQGRGTLYVNGVSVGSVDSATGAFTAATALAIGWRAGDSAEPYRGDVAEVATFSAPLAAADFASLAAGVTPEQVRPDIEAAYLPLVRDVIDVFGGCSPVATGTSAAAHCRVYRPAAAAHPGVPAFSDLGRPTRVMPAVGPPIRGVPWLKRQPFPAQPMIAPASGPVPQPSFAPLVQDGPPIRGVPWRQTWRPPVPRPVIVPAPDPYGPAFAPPPPRRSGPPIMGVPWLRPQAIPAHTTPSLIPAAAPGVATFAPLLQQIPPVRGVPWLKRHGPQVGVSPSATQNPPPPPVPPVDPPLGHAGTAKTLIERVPDAPERMRRFTEKVSAIFNSLMTKGRIFQDADFGWDIDATGATGGGQTGTFTDDF